MLNSTKAIRFMESLTIPQGAKAGEPIKLAPFQKQFVKGALAKDTQVAVLSIGRGNAKTALSAGIALGALLGEWDRQPRREILIAARTRDQARIAWDFVADFARSLPEDGYRGSVKSLYGITLSNTGPECRSSVPKTLINVCDDIASIGAFFVRSWSGLALIPSVLWSTVSLTML